MLRHPLAILGIFALLLVGAVRCNTPQNPRSLWISYSQREIDLQLIDHEPPPF
jgi:hypothetical protein